MDTENLMLTSKSPHAEVKIIDFGLAKLLEPDDTTESFLGTRVRAAASVLWFQTDSPVGFGGELMVVRVCA